MSGRLPLYPRLLRLRHVRPNGWQRAVLGEGALAAAGVLVLADLATAWTLLALPVAVAAVVKSHDLMAGALADPHPVGADGALAAAGADSASGPGPVEGSDAGPATESRQLP